MAHEEMLDTAQGLAERVRSIASSALKEEQTARAAHDIATKAVQCAAAAVDRRLKDEPPKSAFECQSGCNYCCYMRTLVTPPEVLLLADYVLQTNSKEDLAALRNRLHQSDRKAHGMTDAEYGALQIACPLLVDGRCSAYEARPLECRGYNSMSVEACKRAYENYDAWNVPLYLPQYSIFKHVQAGLLMALVGAGLSNEILELNGALLIALTESNAADRWLAGEDIFAPAALSENDPARLAQLPWTPTLFDNLE